MGLPNLSRIICLVLAIVPNCIDVRASVRQYTFTSFAQTLNETKVSLWLLREGRAAQAVFLRTEGLPDGPQCVSAGLTPEA